MTEVEKHRPTCAGCPTVRECQKLPAPCPNLPAAGVHSCSLYCDRPACVLDQRNELRAQLEAIGAGGVSGRMMGAQSGWKLVPIEPTQEMLEAGVKEQHGTAVYKSVARSGCSAYEGDQYANYAAMLSAAPLPPTAQRADHIPDAGKMAADSAVSDALAIVEAELLRLKASFAGLSAIGVLRYAAKDMSITTQPQQSTPAVQPKIPPFIESMHSYKTVWTHLEAEQIEDYGRRCFAAGISAGQQPQQSAVMPDQALSADELELLAITVEQFSEDGETSTDYEVLIDWARRGFLGCERFVLMPKGQRAIDAAIGGTTP